MRSQKERVLAGELYDPLDPQLSAERSRARPLTKALNDNRDDQQDERARLIKELIPASGGGVLIEPPSYCDYGSNIKLGDEVWIGGGAIICPGARSVIGAGSVVTREIPEGVFAAGNPCRVIRDVGG